ncbi:Membrane attack complex component/perforin [Aspergillus affinis]|uniref:Membrane attack complex component/perforin n=1 Tax=Aspergillus affinis TaxID=1070780 RepID=UPI0022FDE72E|nr:Membrane attack complex component/perforin [Aspergillus affinis]KAI9041140.1 Membrane attack complex component/perforin [Aspergillus affinis]
MAQSDPKATALLHVSLVDKATEAIKQLIIVSLEDASIKGVDTLGDIRKLLAEHRALNVRQQQYSFCIPSGAKATDSLKWSKYKQLLKTEDPPKLEVYLLQTKLEGGIDDTTKEFLNQKLDAALTKEPSEANKAQIKELVSAYVASAYTATPGGKISHPAELADRDWDIVLRTTSLLHGYSIATTGDKNSSILLGIERVTRPAFVIKEREMSLYEGFIDSKKPQGGPHAIRTRIPLFNVTDGSSVHVFETKNEVATELARSAFSQTDVETALGGGAAGFSAAVKASLSVQDKQAVENAKKSTQSQIHISYNFPRVVVYLDKDSLELTDECKTDLRACVPAGTAELDTEKVQELFKKYGHFLPTRVELGGRLHSTEQLTQDNKSDAASVSHALKVAASLSFSSPYVQASASASHEHLEESKSQAQASSLSKSICWEADGGDTLLCNNPPAWCSTVGSHYNWRVMKQGNLVPMISLISALLEKESDMENIKTALQKVANGQDQTIVHNQASSQVQPSQGLVPYVDGAENTISKPGNAGESKLDGEYYDEVESTTYFHLKYLKKDKHDEDKYLWVNWQEYWDSDWPDSFRDLDGREEIVEDIKRHQAKYADDFKRAMESSPQKWPAGFISYLAGDRQRMGVVPKPPPKYPVDRPHPGLRPELPFVTTVRGLPNDVNKLHYNTAYTLKIGDCPVCANDAAPGFYHSRYLFRQQTAGFPLYPTPLMFQKSDGSSGTGVIRNGDKVTLHVLSSKKDATGKVVYNDDGGVGKMLKNAVGVDPFAITVPLEFTLEYQ